MTSVVANTFTNSSKAYNLGYILLSYATIFLLIPLNESGEPTTYLVTVAIIGGFFGTFLFLLKPLEKIIYFIANLQYKKKNSELLYSRIFYSPYLGESKAQIIGGILFSLTCLTALFNSNFNLLETENQFLIQLSLIVMGLIIGYSSIRRYNRLTKKFDVLALYYWTIGRNTKISAYPSLKSDLKDALNRKDWDEAFLIADIYYKNAENWASERGFFIGKK